MVFIMPFKCSCGCGQIIPDDSDMVGVPIGNGNFLAFDPQHHQGQQFPMESIPFIYPELAQNLGIAAENPLSSGTIIRDIILDIRRAKRLWKAGKRSEAKKVGQHAKGLYDALTSKEQLKFSLEHPTIEDTLLMGPIKGYRKNIAPVVVAAAPVAARAVRKYGPRVARYAGKVAMKAAEKAFKKAVKGKGRKNPRRPTKEFWKKHYSDVYGYYRRRGMSPTRAERATRGTLGEIWYHSMGRGRKRAYESLRKIREGRKLSVNADDGTINVDGSRVTEIRYIEKKTGIPYKHKLVKPLRMKKRGRKIIVPPMKVSRRGITQ